MLTHGGAHVYRLYYHISMSANGKKHKAESALASCSSRYGKSSEFSRILPTVLVRAYVLRIHCHCRHRYWRMKVEDPTTRQRALADV